MPTDLRSGNGLSLATIFGNASRFNITAPKCVLTTAAKPDQRQVAFRADCHSIAGQTVAAAVKDNFLSCRGNNIDSICGYYVKWGGMPGDPDVATALTETINIAAHRRHCRIY